MAGDLYEQGYYETGTASVTQGQTVVTGQGTAWLQIVRPADDFGKHVGMPVPIASVDSDTQITLAYSWPGPTQTAAPYRVTFTPYHVAYRQALLEIGQLLESGNVSALAGLVGAADKLPMFNGPGSLELISKQDLINGVRFDVQVTDPAGRAAYDNEAAGFTVLVADTGDGRSAIYTKNTIASADWSDPAYITGPVGPHPDVTVGNTTTLDPGSDATVTSTPTAGGVELDFGIPEGRGAKYAGEYDPGTTYVLDNAVLHNGSTWIALQETTGNAPPSLPSTGDANWSLLARRGTDGAGTVSAVSAGAGIEVSSIDPTNPIVGLDVYGRSVKATAYTLLASDYGKSVVASSETAITFSLTSAASLGAKWWAVVKNEGSGVLTIDPSGAETIDDFPTLDVKTGSSLIVVSTGADFYTILAGGAGDFVSYAEAQTLTEEQQGQARDNIGVGQLAGFRNLLINPLGTINQRVYTSGAATSSANQYTIDRWRVVTSGQSLLWTESAGVRTMTAPVGGLEQVIEGASILSGDHVLTWEGTATATVNGSARTSGEVFTLTGGANATVRFSDGTFSKPQLERGSWAGGFSARHRQQELGLCQRFYQKSYDLSVAPNASDSAGCRVALSNSAGTFTAHVDFATRMRVAPVVTLYGPFGGASALSIGESIGESGFHVTQTGGSANSNARFHFVADAEI